LELRFDQALSGIADGEPEMNALEPRKKARGKLASKTARKLLRAQYYAVDDRLQICTHVAQ
jgi:hypothetical protein